jgi:hypothetical protein
MFVDVVISDWALATDWWVRLLHDHPSLRAVSKTDANKATA